MDVARTSVVAGSSRCAVAGLLACALIGAGCGQKGPLVPAADASAAASSQPASAPARR